MDPVALEIANHRLAGIAEEMGVVLGRTAVSPNIKERRDYSCAVFDAQGGLVAQAAHIPVHLGSTPLSVRAALAQVRMRDGDVVILNDAATGAEIRRLGGTGSGPGQLDRPNGVRAIDDILIVVERDNARLQAFSLPALEPLGTFGEEQLRRPYGIAAYLDDQGRIELYVTDNYELVEDQIPPDSALGERVEQFRVWLENGELRHEHVRTFGDTTGAGVLRKVETIAVDAPNDRVVIAEELEPDSHWKIYDLDGRFSGQVFGRGYFPHEAEGLALYACSDGGGYWVATDQDEETNTFHVFDRNTLEHLGAFTGATTRNTDGVALTQAAFGPFPAGAFYAVHNDGNIAAFSWAQIAETLGLRSDCGPEAP